MVMPTRGRLDHLSGSAAQNRAAEPAVNARHTSIVRSIGTVAAVGFGCVLLTVGAALEVLYWFPATQLTHRYAMTAAAFIPYGLVASAGAAIAFTLAIIFGRSSRRWTTLLAVAAIAGLVLHVSWAKPSRPATPQQDGSVTILTMNLRCNPEGTTDLAELVEDLQPDVVVVQGIYRDRQNALGQTWRTLLPHATFKPMTELSKCGTAVFSRTPLQVVRTPSKQQVVNVSGAAPFLLLPVDMPTPTAGLDAWLEDYQELTDAANAHPEMPLVAAGDFNAIREHAPMRTLLATTRLQDAAELAGHGWMPTYPSSPWHPPLFGLDHILVSTDMSVSHIHTHPISEQNHRAVSACIGFSS